MKVTHKAFNSLLPHRRVSGNLYRLSNDIGIATESFGSALMHLMSGAVEKYKAHLFLALTAYPHRCIIPFVMGFFPILDEVASSSPITISLLIVLVITEDTIPTFPASKVELSTAFN